MAELQAYIKHRVQKGESLWKIAKKYGLTGPNAHRTIYELSIDGYSNRTFRETFPDENQIDYIHHGKPVYVWVPITIRYEEQPETQKAFPKSQPLVVPPQGRPTQEKHVTLVEPSVVVYKSSYTVISNVGLALVEQTNSWDITLRTTLAIGNGATLDFDALSKRERGADNAVSITASGDAIALDLFGKMSAEFSFDKIIGVGSGDVVAAIGAKGPMIGITKERTIQIKGLEYTVVATGQVGFDEGTLTYKIIPPKDPLLLGLGASTLTLSYKVLSRAAPAPEPAYDPAPEYDPVQDHTVEYVLFGLIVLVCIVGALTGATEAGAAVLVLSKVSMAAK